MIISRLLSAIVLVVISACGGELSVRKLPIGLDGSHSIEMGAYYNSKNCQGMVFTSYDQSCSDTVTFSYSKEQVIVDIGAYIDSDRKVGRVEASYTMPKIVVDSFIVVYREALQRYGWKVNDAVPNIVLTMKDDALLAEDSTMSVWMSSPTIEKEKAEFIISCFVRTNSTTNKH